MNHAAHAVRILTVALIVPLVLAAAVVIVGLSLAARLPARIPVHWDLSGHVNGYGSPYQLVVTFVAVCVPIIAIFGGAVVLWSHRVPLSLLAKVLAVASFFVTVSVGAVFIGLLSNVGAGAHPAGLLGVSFASAAIVSVIAWFALPRGARGVAGTSREAVAPVTLSHGERASWIRSTSASPAIAWSLVGLGIVLSAVTVFATISSGGQGWAVSFVPLGVILLSLSMFAWTVRVDARGVRIRAALGIPVFHVPLDQITSADVIDVQAIAQYGGWGIRIALNSRLGIILRSGEALEVHRTKGLNLVITIDDASSAAGLINGMVQREGSPLP